MCISLKRRLMVWAMIAAFSCIGCSLSGEAVTGWRGNWTGRFPDQHPPVTWRKVSTAMAGLRCAAQKPKDDKAAGLPAFDGSLREWLVLGPLPSAGGEEAINEAFLPDEAKHEPTAGAKVKDAVWRKVTVEGSVLDFASVFAKDLPDGVVWLNSPPFYRKPYAAYAHTYLYSPQEAKVQFCMRAFQQAKVYVNGALILDSTKAKKKGKGIGGRPLVPFHQGWNRVLYKACNQPVPGEEKKVFEYPSSWFVDLGLRSLQPFEITNTNILWSTRLPDYGVACPLVVGGKVFVLSEPGDLICLDKANGHVLWVRSISFYDQMSKEEQQNPAFQALGPLVKERQILDAEYERTNDLTQDAVVKRRKVVSNAWRQMEKVDKKYRRKTAHGICMATPVSDGKYIYVWLQNGIAACFDLEGKRKWITLMERQKGQEHGYAASPVLLSGRVITFWCNKVFGFDVESGKLAWETAPGKIKTYYHGSPVPLRLGGEDLVWVCHYLVRARDGEVVWEGKTDRWSGGYTTPIADEGLLCGINTTGRTIKATVPSAAGKIEDDTYPGRGQR